ncbi:Transcriptional regulatory protein FixJ [Rhodoplanes serenus]|uniref:Transcriptional regulatory protein FixJ n=1 Tax=Rhodoplanes serenus TaxID=200615 RepID=A0A3S4BZV0_9BRAD|nr:response regulator [Rhodoplanes serenus]VCU11510.1 Transcriptional regulatory protein FixJ [Rhodoplanes serenus]
MFLQEQLAGCERLGSGFMAVHVVEDDPGVSDSLSLLLEHLGFEVVRHTDAEDLFRSAPPSGNDIVFVDLILPGISGAELLRWLTNLKDPPRIVVMSGQSQSTIDLQLRGIDGMNVIRKPLSHGSITQQLAQLIA